MKEESKLYNKKYAIVFYEKDDDTLKYVFDNCREVCKALGWEINSKNLNKIQVDIFRSVRRTTHRTNLFRGQNLHVYIIDILEECE